MIEFGSLLESGHHGARTIKRKEVPTRGFDRVVNDCMRFRVNHHGRPMRAFRRTKKTLHSSVGVMISFAVFTDTYPWVSTPRPVVVAH